MTIKELLQLVGGLSEPSKMPCHSWSISAFRCAVGSRLRKIKNSICSICYALKNRYLFENVQEALDRRYDVMMRDRKAWVVNMIAAIYRVEKSGYFRWFDSGDVVDLEHLKGIVAIARALPGIQFWLPTKEYTERKLVQRFLKHDKFPDNLTVRLSAYVIDGPPPTAIAKKLGVVTSGVSKGSFNCPAPSQGNKCGSCRACWDRNVQNINYKAH